MSTNITGMLGVKKAGLSKALQYLSGEENVKVIDQLSLGDRCMILVTCPREFLDSLRDDPIKYWWLVYSVADSFGGARIV